MSLHNNAPHHAPIPSPQNDLDLEQMQGMQPTLYHRYGVLDDVDDDDDNDNEGANAAHAAGGDAFNANAYGSILADAMQRMDISDGAAGAEGADGAAGGYGGHRAVGAGEPGDERGAQGGANIGSWSLLSHPWEWGVKEGGVSGSESTGHVICRCCHLQPCSGLCFTQWS